MIRRSLFTIAVLAIMPMCTIAAAQGFLDDSESLDGVEENWGQIAPQASPPQTIPQPTPAPLSRVSKVPLNAPPPQAPTPKQVSPDTAASWRYTGSTFICPPGWTCTRTPPKKKKSKCRSRLPSAKCNRQNYGGGGGD